MHRIFTPKELSDRKEFNERRIVAPRQKQAQAALAPSESALKVPPENLLALRTWIKFRSCQRSDDVSHP